MNLDQYKRLSDFKAVITNFPDGTRAKEPELTDYDLATIDKSNVGPEYKYIGFGYFHSALDQITMTRQSLQGRAHFYTKVR